VVAATEEVPATSGEGVGSGQRRVSTTSCGSAGAWRPTGRCASHATSPAMPSAGSRPRP